MPILTQLELKERELVHSELQEKPIEDDRFLKLLGNKAWERLPVAIQRRFGRHIEDGKSVIYKGVITKMEMNLAGKMLANLCRIFGTPLPIDTDTVGTAAVVTVTEDKASNGQFWTRTYTRKAGFPQVIHSSKRFSGKTGLEEYIGFGISMDLKVSAQDDAIVFSSAGFNIAIGNWKLKFPRFLEPGNVTVSHADQGEGYFAFILEVSHSIFGKMIHQRGIFCEHETVVV